MGVGLLLCAGDSAEAGLVEHVGPPPEGSFFLDLAAFGPRFGVRADVRGSEGLLVGYVGGVSGPTGTDETVFGDLPQLSGWRLQENYTELWFIGAELRSFGLTYEDIGGGGVSVVIDGVEAAHLSGDGSVTFETDQGSPFHLIEFIWVDGVVGRAMFDGFWVSTAALTAVPAPGVALSVLGGAFVATRRRREASSTVGEAVRSCL